MFDQTRTGSATRPLPASARHTDRRRPGSVSSRGAVVRETRGGWDVGGDAAGRRVEAGESSATYIPPAAQRTDDTDEAGDPHGEAARTPAGAVAGLRGAVDELLEVDVDALVDEQMVRVLADVQVELDRLHAFRSTWAAVLESRAVRRAGNDRRSRTVAKTRRNLQEKLRLTPSETKRMTQTGQQLEKAPATRRRYQDGQLRPEQAEVISRTIQEVPLERRDDVEATLLEAAKTQNAIELGRTARRLLGEIDLEAAERAERRRHLRRSARISQTPDGGVAFSGTLYGVAAELAMTAVNAFRLPDPPGGPGRTPEQATADAFEAVFGAALDVGKAPQQHGERPHVLVIVDVGVLAEQAGFAELGFTGPITFEQVRPLLDDCSMARIALDSDGIPLEAGEKVRTVPAALWRYLQYRDRGCRFAGCTAPASWCDVAHGADAYRADGRLSPSNSVLLCRRHHRRFDLENWTIRIDGDEVLLEPPKPPGPPGPPGRPNARTRAGP